MSSSPVDIPKVHYGCLMDSANNNAAWSWLNVPNPIFRCSVKVDNISFMHLDYIYRCFIWRGSLFVQIKSLLSTRQFSVVTIPVKNQHDSLTKGICHTLIYSFPNSLHIAGWLGYNCHDTLLICKNWCWNLIWSILGARKPFEAIFVSSKPDKNGALDPLLVILHGGPHFVSLTNFSKSWAFLCSIGYSLLIVNYRFVNNFYISFCIIISLSIEMLSI